jgi:hypothetical protein
VKRILAAAVGALFIVGMFVPDLGAIRRKEERTEDAQRAIAAAERGDFLGAVQILAALDMEDPYEFVDHTIRAGRHDQSRDDIQDFSCNHEDAQCRMRKLFMQDIGDPPEIGFGRMGPDGAPYNHDSPEEVPPGTALGLLYWRIWEANGGGWRRRMAQIWARYQGNNDGSLHLATAKNGELQERLSIDGDGTWHFQNMPWQPAANGQVRVAVTVNGAPMWLLMQPR